MNKVLITGSSGMLGKDIFSSFNSSSNFEAFGVDIVISENINGDNQFIGNLTDENFLHALLEKVKPNLIINCAAIVDLKICEEKKRLAEAIHLGIPNNLIKYGQNKTKIIHISTDSIFDGEKGNYTEKDIPNPLNYYAKTKLAGEEIILESSSLHLIIRTNIIGFNKPLKNSLAEWAISNIIAGKRINGYTDIIFNAIYTKDLANIILNLIEAEISGLINVASKNVLSKYSFLKYLSLFLSNRNDLVQPIRSDDVVFGITRPKNTSLNVSKAESIVNLPTIELGIENLIKDFKGLADEKN